MIKKIYIGRCKNNTDDLFIAEEAKQRGLDIIMASDITGLGPHCGHKDGDNSTIRHVLLEHCQPIFTIIPQELESISPRIAQ
jgi:hypothetical protein